MLRSLTLKQVYKSETDNIMSDFYIPVLQAGNRLDRAVGYFSGITLSYAAQGLSAFFSNGGKARLIVGAFTDEEDLEAVCRGYQLRNLSELVGEELISSMEQVESELVQFRLEVIAKLIQANLLDMKVAIRRRGMYHEKFGIVSDEFGNSVTFMGSANESIFALLPGYNYESISVYPSWIDGLSGYINPHIESFERLWSNQEHNTVVIEPPRAVLDRLHIIACKTKERNVDMEQSLWEKLVQSCQDCSTIEVTRPRVPDTLGGRQFSIRDHQKDALNSWKNADYRGILALATGAGKTVTALYGIIKIAEAGAKLVVVIAVPYQNLADQWVEVAEEFGLKPIQCYVSKANWIMKLNQATHNICFGLANLTVIVVVNRTLRSPEFQLCLRQFPASQLLWIGDECHHHGTEGLADFLPTQARFRMGLSATPMHYLNEQRNERLIEFYGGTVYEFTLEQAIQKGILTPYYYFVVVVDLTYDETLEYLELSSQLGALLIKQERVGLTQNEQEILQTILRNRARLVGSAQNKLTELNKLLDRLPVSHNTLFYCAEGSNYSDMSADIRCINEVCELLNSRNWKIAKFTSEETRGERESILELFRTQKIDALVAMRCLDEGIDIPGCSTAFILASARDPRQFIQRRGRILRKSSGKDFSTIYDFVVIPNSAAAQAEHQQQGRTLVKSELKRVAEFASLSLSRENAYQSLRDTLTRYGLEYMV